jgi:hypothetical protein
MANIAESVLPFSQFSPHPLFLPLPKIFGKSYQWQRWRKNVTIIFIASSRVPIHGIFNPPSDYFLLNF